VGAVLPVGSVKVEHTPAWEGSVADLKLVRPKLRHEGGEWSWQ
jgi:hypothetical protein